LKFFESKPSVHPFRKDLLHAASPDFPFTVLSGLFYLPGSMLLTTAESQACRRGFNFW
jgi:hypothetical protein